MSKIWIPQREMHKTSGRCGQKDPDYMEENSPEETNAQNAKQTITTFFKSLQQKGIKIMKVKYRRNNISRSKKNCEILYKS